MGALISAAVMALAVVMVAAPALWVMVHGFGDYSAHIWLIQQALQDGSWQPHFFFQVLVWAVAGFSKNTTALTWAMLNVALGALIAKGWLTYRFFERSFTAEPVGSRIDARLGFHPQALSWSLAFASLVLMPVARPGGLANIYLGQIAPNVWHNPTILVVWPMTLALFFTGVRYLQNRKTSTLALVGALAVLSAVTKPNSVMVFLPAFAVCCVWRLRSVRALMKTFVAMVPVLVVLVVQWRWTFSNDPRKVTANTRVIFAPLQAWHIYSSSVLESTLLSIAFPLAFLVLRWKTVRSSLHLGLAWSMFVAGWLWTALFAESGGRMADFNFIWGAHLASYVLFVATIAELVRAPFAAPTRDTRLRRWLDGLLWSVLGVHLISGVVYFSRITLGLA